VPADTLFARPTPEPSLNPSVAAPIAAPLFKAPPPPSRPLELQSYIISPYKSGSDSENEEEHPRKPVPAWARSEALGPVLYAQAKHDPDAIFLNPARTCSLSDVFQCAGNKKRDFTRRGSSGDWAGDELGVAEEMAFRRRFFGAGAAH
jgi:Inner centromere protein, ARK binding region